MYMCVTAGKKCFMGELVLTISAGPAVKIDENLNADPKRKMQKCIQKWLYTCILIPARSALHAGQRRNSKKTGQITSAGTRQMRQSLLSSEAAPHENSDHGLHPPRAAHRRST